MSKISEYKQLLSKLDDWDDFLVNESNLPSPRANLELLHAAVEAGAERHFIKYIEPGKVTAQVNDPLIFPLLVSIAGLGKLIGEGSTRWFSTLKYYAGDERWRVREAVAIALQITGDSNMKLLVETMHAWKSMDCYIQRAVVAALCEPRLLKNKSNAEEVIGILEVIVNNLANAKNKREDAFKTLRQALAYGISVAVVALPEKGKSFMEKLAKTSNPDLRWIMKENLKKNRLVRMDAEWTKKMLSAF